MHRLLSDRLICGYEALLASYPFLCFLLLRGGQGCTPHDFRTPDPRGEKSKLKMIRRPQIQRETQLANKLREARENAREQVVIGSIFSQYPLRGRRKLSGP